MLARPVAVEARRRSPRREAAREEEKSTTILAASRRRNPARQSHVIAPPSNDSGIRTVAVGQGRKSLSGDRNLAEVQARVAVVPGQGKKTTAADREKNVRPSARLARDEQVFSLAAYAIIGSFPGRFLTDPV